LSHASSLQNQLFTFVIIYKCKYWVLTVAEKEMINESNGKLYGREDTGACHDTCIDPEPV
jgi:hypothetical protein